MQSGTNEYRLVTEGRLDPNQPGQKKIIDGHLAMLAVTDPDESAKLRALYDAKTIKDEPQAEVPEAKAPAEETSHALGEPKEEKPKRKNKKHFPQA